MKHTGSILLTAIFLFLAVFAPLPAAAAPFDPTVLKVSVDPEFWQNYHLPAASVYTDDVVKVYKIKKADVTLLVGDKEWATCTFTPEKSKEQSINIPHGLTNLRIKLRAYTAEEVSWTYIIDYKSISFDRVYVSSSSGTKSIHDPILR